MNNIIKKVIIISGGVICLLIMVLAVKWIIDRPYRSQIPSLPDLKTVSIALKEQLTEASKNASQNPTSNNLGILGTVYHASAYYDQAAQCYKLAVKKNTSKWIWSYYLGYLNREMGESQASIENFKTVTKENPDMYLAWYYAGQGFQDLSQNEQAELVFDKVANFQNGNATGNTRNTSFPINVYALYQIARIKMNIQQTDQAEKKLNEIIQTYPTFGPAYKLLASIYKSRGDSAMSKEFRIRSYDLPDFTPPFDPLINRLAMISRSELYILKQIDEAEKNAYPEFAIAIATNALKFIPDNKYLISKYIKLNLKMDRVKESLPYLNKNLSNFRDNFNELREVADLLYDKKIYPQALEYYSQAGKLKPENAEIQSSRMLCLANKGDKAQAIELMNQLIDRDKNNLRLLSNGVYVMMVMGEKDKASLYLSRLKQLDPKSAKVQQLEGMLLENSGKLSEAMVIYESSNKSNPKDMATIQALGELLIKQKQWDKAIVLYKKSLGYYPNEPYLLEKMGTILITCPDANLRNLTEGKKFSERAFIHKGSTTSIAISAGKSIASACAVMGEKQKAYLYTEMILAMAQKERAPRELIEELERDLKHYSE